MNVIQIADCHARHGEPFFRALAALDRYVLDELARETEPFVFLDSGDRFHTSKETGRVNGEVANFFLALARNGRCRKIYAMQGNHDVKEDTGSALDLLRGIDPKIVVVDEPRMVESDGGGDLIYLLPHCRPYSIDGYAGVKSYGGEEFHRKYWDSRGEDWGKLKARIKMVSMHGGDETSGKLFMSADISFLPGLKSNGHVHKAVSSHCLPSAMVTRRDETDKPCAMRRIGMDAWTAEDIPLPLFLNYASLEYGKDTDDIFKSGVHVKPRESLIVDIYGHDDRDAVMAEYSERWKSRENPRVYIGDVTPVERRGEADGAGGDSEEKDLATIDVKELFREFCAERKIESRVADDLAARIA